MNKYIKVKDVAEILSVSPKTVYQWAELHQIPSYKINGCLRFSLDEVLEKVNSCKTKVNSGN